MSKECFLNYYFTALSSLVVLNNNDEDVTVDVVVYKRTQIKSEGIECTLAGTYTQWMWVFVDG